MEVAASMVCMWDVMCQREIVFGNITTMAFAINTTLKLKVIFVDALLFGFCFRRANNSYNNTIRWNLINVDFNKFKYVICFKEITMRTFKAPQKN